MALVPMARIASSGGLGAPTTSTPELACTSASHSDSRRPLWLGSASAAIEAELQRTAKPQIHAAGPWLREPEFMGLMIVEYLTLKHAHGFGANK